MLPLVTVGLDHETTTVLTENPSPNDGQTVHHFTSAEQALLSLGDLATSGGVELDPETGEYRVHVAYGANVLGAAATDPKSVRLPVTGLRLLIGAAKLPEHKPRRVVDNAIMGSDDDTMWIQGAYALHVQAIINIHQVGTDFLWAQVARDREGE